MKNKIFKIVGVLIIIILLISNFGINIGSIRIGKQADLQTKQKQDIENSYFYINHFSKDNLIVMNLWATWCEPCVTEIPTLNIIKSKFKNDKISFVSLSVDNDSVKLFNFNLKETFKYDDITFKDLKHRNAILNLLENKKLDKWISSKTVPITYLIKNKKILKKINGEITLDELTNEINKYK